MKTKETNCLDSIINNFFNDGKPCKVFLKNVKKDEDGYVKECFTKTGGKLYEKMVDALYSIGNNFGTIRDLKEFLKSLENIGIPETATFNDVVETCDSIVSDNI